MCTFVLKRLWEAAELFRVWALGQGLEFKFQTHPCFVTLDLWIGRGQESLRCSPCGRACSGASGVRRGWREAVHQEVLGQILARSDPVWPKPSPLHSRHP